MNEIHLSDVRVQVTCTMCNL